MTKKKKIKAIIFDLGGVIAHGGYLPFIHHYCMECLTPVGKKKIAHLERQVDLGKITERQFYVEISRIFHVHLTPKQMHNLIVRKMKIDRRLIKFIPHLKKAKVALFSNSIGHMAAEVIKKQGLGNRKVFDRVFFSNKMHLVKPDLQAYAYVVKQLKVKPGQALMVDDRLENIQNARKLGMEGIVYKNSRQFKQALKRYELT